MIYLNLTALLNFVFNDIEATSIGNKKNTGIPVNA